MSSNFDTNWDVEKYKSEFESEEHWQLRREFLLSHKDKYPEDKLVCLAQVFFNVELLGCRYPDETMALVSELSEGIADGYREKKQQKIQRTFVKASDAAGAKIKGLSSSEIVKISDTAENPNAINFNPSSAHYSISKEHESIISKSTVDLINAKEVNNLLRDMVILKNLNEDFFNQGACIIQRSFAKKNLKPEYQLTQQTENKEKIVWECVLSVRGIVLAQSSATSKQISRKAVNEAFLHALQEICYTVEEKTKFVGDGSTVGKDNDKAEETSERVPDSNVGSKMMKLMGWKGGGLGKSEQGRAEPVAVQDRVHRAGFGTNLTKTELRKRLNSKLSNYAREESHYDLVFSNDFSKDERAELHKLAQKFHLSSRSYGTGDNRHLVISRQVHSHTSLVTLLLGCGGENERYKLIPPLNTLYE